MSDPTLQEELPPTRHEERTTMAVITAVAAISTGAGLLNATSSTHTFFAAHEARGVVVTPFSPLTSTVDFLSIRM